VWRVKLGELELRFVSDGHFRLDGGMMFGIVPRVVWERRRPPDELNRVGLQLNCLLIQRGNEYALVDTGLGTNLTPHQRDVIWGLAPGPRLLDSLAALGLAPQDISLVINTHLHIDHCGGDTLLRDGRLRPTFPRARYLVQRQEWQDTLQPNERTRGSYFPELLRPLAEEGLLELLDGDTQVNSYLRCLLTPGHTRGHQSVLVGEGPRKALHLGDAAPFSEHFEKLSWIPGMDLSQLDSLEAKRRLLQQALENDYLLIFYHEDELATARLVREGADYRIVPVSAS
jgi:glyoxylase-like metal-dependent hydrolase (beta-lactamase superfamily II)